MTTRMRSVWIAIAVLNTACMLAPDAHARRSHGEGGTSRSCLTGPARNLLSRIEQQFGAVQIVSTCRPGATIRGTGRTSRHASGNAIDFSAGAKKGAVVRWLLANHHNGGTMTYPGMSHIHVDIGPRFVSLTGQRTRVASRGSKREQTRVAQNETYRSGLSED